MEILASVLPIVIDVLLIVLITVGIILLIKCIYIVDKTKDVILNVEEKVNSLNNLFTIVDLVNSKVGFIYDKIGGIVEALISRFKSDKTEEEELYEIEKKERKRRK